MGLIIAVTFDSIYMDAQINVFCSQKRKKKMN